MVQKVVISLLLATVTLGYSCQQPSSSGKDTEKQNSFSYSEMTIRQMQEGFETGKFTIREVVQAYIDRIEAIDQNGPALHSVIIVNPDALTLADSLDSLLKEGKTPGSMYGIPVLLKDNIDTHDKMPTTAGSRSLADSHPLQDSWIVKRLREEGAVILGKTNLSEWANFRGQLSSSGWSGVGGQTKNPYYLDRNPCGSSSGSGVAVSANLCMVAIGTETNGSVVCPSTANGIVGIKPTVGLASRSGIIPISFTQDTPGPMARTVADAAICLGAIAGIDPADSKTAASKGKVYKDYTQFLKKDGLTGKRIGFFTTPSADHFKVDTLMRSTVELLKKLGAEIIEIDKIADPVVNELSFKVMLYEYKDGLNNYFASLGEDAPIHNVDELIEFNKKDSIELSIFNQEYLLMANSMGSLSDEEYKQALQKMQQMIRADGIDKVMDENNLDALIAPTGSPAWKTDWVNGDAYILGSSSPAAISGYPNITVPMGFIDGLPVGISFFGRAWSEPVLLEMAYAFEQASMQRRPPGFKPH